MLGSQPQAICLAFRARRNAATLVDVPASDRARRSRPNQNPKISGEAASECAPGSVSFGPEGARRVHGPLGALLHQHSTPTDERLPARLTRCREVAMWLHTSEWPIKLAH